MRLLLEMRRVLRQVPPALLIVLMVSSGGTAMDHSDLEKVLKTMPPNGPFWKYGNVVLGSKSRKAGMAPVIFSHWSHRSRYTCRVCHQELGFSMRQGDSGINRSQSLAGKFCAACHNGTIAFTVKDGPQAQCKNCHMESTAALEEQFAEFSASLPMSPFGNGIDWAAALKNGSIAPVNTLASSGQLIQFPAKLRQPLKLGTSSPRSDVSFSHEDHFAELDCSSCHPDIFNIKKKSTAAFSMDSNIFGGFCGACHMQVAFPMNDCKRCHKTMSNRQY
jgi:c(7)-type cytochrome triheme protein